MPHDSQLKQSVLAELNWEPSVSAAHIGVIANAGVVTLTGHVENFIEKHAAEVAACRVKGVKSGFPLTYGEDVAALTAWGALGTTAVENNITVA